MCLYVGNVHLILVQNICNVRSIGPPGLDWTEVKKKEKKSVRNPTSSGYHCRYHKKIILYLAWYQLTVSKTFAILMIDYVCPSITSIYSLSLYTGRVLLFWLFWSPRHPHFVASTTMKNHFKYYFFILVLQPF
jgi:hypothetical protein